MKLQPDCHDTVMVFGYDAQAMTERAMTSYIHHTPGRLRVRSPLIKRNEAAAGKARDLFSRHPGVETVETNPTTGSITIRYAPHQVDHRSLLSLLDDHGHLRSPQPTPAPAENRLAESIGSTVGTMLLEKLVERSATALIAALI